MIELRGLIKKYGIFTAIAGISLSIEQEMAVAVVGPSGSGKTTLLRLIAGLECPDAGEIFIQGKRVSKEHALCIRPDERKLGMIFQDLALWPHMTTGKNIEFGLESLKIKKAERKERIERIAEKTHIAALLSRYPDTLSGGEKQRVALARTLVLEPKIILMDEPLTSLDTVQKDELMAMIAELCKKMQITRVYVTHDREEALCMAEKMIVMDQGRIVQEGSIQELQEAPKTEFVKRFFRKK